MKEHIKLKQGARISLDAFHQCYRVIDGTEVLKLRAQIILRDDKFLSIPVYIFSNGKDEDGRLFRAGNSVYYSDSPARLMSNILYESNLEIRDILKVDIYPFHIGMYSSSEYRLLTIEPNCSFHLADSGIFDELSWETGYQKRLMVRADWNPAWFGNITLSNVNTGSKYVYKVIKWVSICLSNCWDEKDAIYVSASK